MTADELRDRIASVIAECMSDMHDCNVSDLDPIDIETCGEWADEIVRLALPEAARALAITRAVDAARPYPVLGFVVLPSDVDNSAETAVALLARLRAAVADGGDTQ